MDRSLESPCKRSDGTDPGSRASPGALHSTNGSDSWATEGKAESTRLPTSVASSPSGAVTKSTPLQLGAGGPLASAGAAVVGYGGADLGECEPIVERSSGLADQLLTGLRGLSPLRSSGSRSGGFGECEPIIERGVARPASLPTALPAPGPPARSSRTPPPPAPGASIGSRLSQSYFRQLGVRTSWQPGDTAFWRGQACKVVRTVPEDQPVCAVLRTPDGTEVTTDLCLLSEAPSTVRPLASDSTPTGEGGARPLRLAPLGDLFIERPSALDRPAEGPQPQHKPPALPSPRGPSEQGVSGPGLGLRSSSGGLSLRDGGSGSRRTFSPLGPVLGADRGRGPPSRGPSPPGQRVGSPLRFAPVATAMGL